MEFIVNIESDIKIAISGKSQAAIRQEIIDMGGNMGKTSLSELLSRKPGREVVCGFSVVDMVEAPNTDKVIVTTAAEFPGTVEKLIKASDAKAVAQTAKPDEKSDDIVETVAAPKTSAFAALMGGNTPAAVVASKAAKKDKPAKKVVRIKGRNLDIFKTEHGDLVKAVESVATIIRCAQGRILLVDGNKEKKQYFHVNVLKSGFSITEYISGKATKNTRKVDDLKLVAKGIKEMVAV